VSEEHKTPTPEEQAAVKVNEQSVEKLAEVTKSLVQEEAQKLFGKDLAEAMSNARAAIDAKAELAKRTSLRKEGAQKMSLEQQGEWLKCQLLGYAPDPDLDVDGVISQSLGRTINTQAIGPGTNPAGGYLLPEDFQAEIVRKADEPAVVWPLVRKQRTNSMAVVKPAIETYIAVNKGTDAKSGSTVSADNITENEPVYKEFTWTMRYFDNLVYAKMDLLEDSPIDVMEDISWQTGDAMSVQHEYNVLQGAGSASSLPLGVLNDTDISSVDFGGAPTVARVLDFYRQLDQRYRARAVAIMDGEIMFSIAEELATNVRSAQYLMDKLPAMLESAQMPANKIVVADWMRYEVFWNRMMYIMSVPNPKKFAMEISVVEKWDGQATLKDAFLIGTNVTPGS
jgi:HK97 family phage major capsid protein